MHSLSTVLIAAVVVVGPTAAARSPAADPPDRAAAAALPVYPEHQDLSYVLNAVGERRPIRTRADWEERRRHVLGGLERVMGPRPPHNPDLPLELTVDSDGPFPGAEQLRLRRVRFRSEPDAPPVTALLLSPMAAAAAPRPAMLCLHQTTDIGKAEPAGLGGLPSLHYARELADRGYVALAPDYPSFGDYPYEFDSSRGYASGSMKAIVDNGRAVDLLQSLPEVDPARIGCIGHSLGGHNAIFTAVFEPRLQVVVSSCGFTRFHKYYEGRLEGWTSPRYMPRIKTQFGADPDRVPVDFPELLGTLAPRPVFVSAPIGDENFEVSGVRDCISAARPVYALYAAEDQLQLQTPDCGHDFPPEVRAAAYEFVDRVLRP